MKHINSIAIGIVIGMMFVTLTTVRRIERRVDGIGTFVACSHYGGTVVIEDTVSDTGEVMPDNARCSFGE